MILDLFLFSSFTDREQSMCTHVYINIFNFQNTEHVNIKVPLIVPKRI